MNQQATPNQTTNDTSMSGMGNQCKVALSDMVNRFLSSGIGIDYQINTQMLQKSTDGTWQPSDKSQDSNANGNANSNTNGNANSNNQNANQTPPKGMTKKGSIKIGTPDLVVGMLMICLFSGLCMGVHGIKRMFH